MAVKKTTIKEYEQRKFEILASLDKVEPFENDTEEKKRKRIEKAKNDHFFFCKTYLPHYFGEHKTPEFHHELVKAIETKGRTVIPIAAPRGHAKSTVITLGKSLHMILFKKEYIIPIVSDTNDQALERVAEIRVELEANERIIHDFGEFDISGKEDNFIINDEIKIRAIGSGQKVRGLRMRQHRPGLIICDDLENDEAVLSEERRKKLWKWFKTVLMPALHPTHGRIFIVGTIMHYDSLLSNLIQQYNGKIYKAISEDGTILWPERFPKEKLEALKEDMGPTLFNQEYNNDPIDEENQRFKLSRISTFKTINEPTRKFRYIDPAVGKNKKSDYSAVVNGEIGKNTKTIYITDIYLRKTTFQNVMEYILEDYRIKSHEKTAMEAVAFQEIGKQWLDTISKQRRLYMPLVSHIPKASKESRIESLVPLTETGTIKFFGEVINGEFHSPIADMKVLIEQFIRYPRAKNDDGPDAVAGLVEIARTGNTEYKSEQRQGIWEKLGMGGSFF